jgi:hypothetical protein
MGSSVWHLAHDLGREGRDKHLLDRAVLHLLVVDLALLAVVLLAAARSLTPERSKSVADLDLGGR